MGVSVSSRHPLLLQEPHSSSTSRANVVVLANGRNLFNSTPPNSSHAAGSVYSGDHRSNSQNRTAARDRPNSGKDLSEALAGLAGEEDMKVLTGHADPVSLGVLQLIQDADTLPLSAKAEKLRILQQCYPLLQRIPAERFDQMSLMVYQREGKVHHQSGDVESAKEAYGRVITLAEKRVARGDTKDAYVVLKHYVLSMIGLANIWYEHERDMRGFHFVSARHPRAATMDPYASDDGKCDFSITSIESTLSSAGSIFSLGAEVLRSMAPRLPRSRTGPNIARLNLHDPREFKVQQFNVEDDFVLHSKMTRELIASPCELLLLRCCEVVSIGHNCQSELLIPPLLELAKIYEDLQLYTHALLLVRRCHGILCNVYDYDHLWIIQLMERVRQLNKLQQGHAREAAAIKIQSTWKMHLAMCRLALVLNRPVRRHLWIPRKYRIETSSTVLSEIARDVPSEEEEGDAKRTAVLQPRRLQDATDCHSKSDQRLGSEDVVQLRVPSRHNFSEPVDGGCNAPLHPAVMSSQPLTTRNDANILTTSMTDARVVGTTQESVTDTHVNQSEIGDVLTVRTTTVTRTIIEKLVASDEEDSTDEEGIEGVWVTNDSHPSPVSLERAGPPTPPRCARCHLAQPAQRCSNCDVCLVPLPCCNPQEPGQSFPGKFSSLLYCPQCNATEKQLFCVFCDHSLSQISQPLQYPSLLQQPSSDARTPVA